MELHASFKCSIHLLQHIKDFSITLNLLNQPAKCTCFLYSTDTKVVGSAQYQLVLFDGQYFISCFDKVVSRIFRHLVTGLQFVIQINIVLCRDNITKMSIIFKKLLFYQYDGLRNQLCKQVTYRGWICGLLYDMDCHVLNLIDNESLCVNKGDMFFI